MDKQPSTFQISYDIKSTENHTIDAEVLGKAILNTANTIKNTNKLLNGEDTDIKVEVRAQKKGSFVVEFITYLNAVGINPLTTLGFVAAPVLTAGSVVGALRELRSRNIQLVEKQNNNKTKLILDDHSSIELEPEIAEVVLNNDIRKSLDEVIHTPLEGASEGAFRIKNENGDDIYTIPVENSKAYARPTRQTVDKVEELDETKDIHFTKVNFEGTSGWQIKLPNGDLVSAKMSDEAFIERINQNKQNFSKEALFSVNLKTTITHKHGSTSPRYSREIVKVLRHRASAENKIL